MSQRKNQKRSPSPQPPSSQWKMAGLSPDATEKPHPGIDIARGIKKPENLGAPVADPDGQTDAREGELSRYPGTDLDRRTFLAGMAALGAAGMVGCKGKKEKAGPTPQTGQKKTSSKASGRNAGKEEKPQHPTARKSTDNDVSRQTRSTPSTRSTHTARGVVFRATNHGATDAKGRAAAKPVGEMLDWLVKELVGKPKVEDCWATLFSPKDVVGIKPNAFATRWNEPSPALIDAIVARLNAVGIPNENIYLWDHWNFKRGPLYAHLRHSPIHVSTQKKIGYDKTIHRLPTGGWVRFNKWVPTLTAIVNVPVFKDHDLAGVTCSMKNLAMGSIINPASHHPNSCSPSVPQIYALPELGPKVRLIVADAFRVIYDKGPFGSKSRNFNARHDSLYVATDPVAMDRIAWDIIDGLRKQRGLPPLMDRGHGPKKVGRPIHVLYAGSIGLGEPDLAKIHLKAKDFG